MVERLARKNRLFIRNEDKLATKFVKCNIKPLTTEEQDAQLAKAQKNLESRKQIPLQESQIKMMLSVSAYRTRVHHHERHFCTLHKKKVDKHHLDECCLLRSTYKPTEFNEVLETKQINDLVDSEKMKILQHYDWLHGRIALLVGNKNFMEVDNRLRVATE